MAEILAFDPAMMVWIDEPGCDKRNALTILDMGLEDYHHKTTSASTHLVADAICSMEALVRFPSILPNYNPMCPEAV